MMPRIANTAPTPFPAATPAPPRRRIPPRMPSAPAMIKRTPAAVTTPGRLDEGCPGEGGGGGAGYSDMGPSPSSAHGRKTSGYSRANCKPPNALDQGTEERGRGTAGRYGKLRLRERGGVS